MEEIYFLKLRIILLRSTKPVNPSWSLWQLHDGPHIKPLASFQLLAKLLFSGDWNHQGKAGGMKLASDIKILVV